MHAVYHALVSSVYLVPIAYYQILFSIVKLLDIWLNIHVTSCSRKSTEGLNIIE